MCSYIAMYDLYIWGSSLQAFDMSYTHPICFVIVFPTACSLLELPISLTGAPPIRSAACCGTFVAAARAVL